MSRPKKAVSANHQKSIIAQYKKGGEGNGLVAIAKRLGYGVQIVRRVLADGKVKIRGRGRPRVA